MDEAQRKSDLRMWNLCAERIRRHVEVGWDWVYGGLSQWVNVDRGDYIWPVERPSAQASSSVPRRIPLHEDALVTQRDHGRLPEDNGAHGRGMAERFSG